MFEAKQGTVYRCIHSVIVIGINHTIYCPCRVKGQYILKNADIRDVSALIRQVDVYDNGSYIGTVEEFYVNVQTDSVRLAMRCAKYGDKAIMEKYHQNRYHLHPDCVIQYGKEA